MDKKYILVDSYNLFFRALHTCKSGDLSLDKGMMIHSMIMMMKKACDMFKPNHIIIFRDGFSSWRYDLYSRYKANRVDKINEMTPAECHRFEELKKLFEEDFIPFMQNNTNVSVLGFPKAEADDLISRFVLLHPDDTNIIVSTDNDFVQLVSKNTFIFNSMEDRIITKDCIIDVSKKKPKPITFSIKDGKVSVSKVEEKIKTNEQLTPMPNWTKYALFSKCIRGDKSDNIPSSYPGVREKSTKKSVGMLEAFADMDNNGYNWVNFMNQQWIDDFGDKHIVKEDYERNKKLIDMNMIPKQYSDNFDKYIIENLNRQEKSGIVFKFSKFLKKYELNKLLEDLNYYVGYFNKKYEN